MNQETINSLADNAPNLLKSAMLKIKYTCNALNKEEIQALYNPNHYVYLSKHQKQQAIKANELKANFNNKFNAHLEKNLRHFINTNLKINFNIKQYTSFNLALQKRTNSNSYGAIKNKVIWILNHFINKNITSLQIAYIVECSVRYVQIILKQLKNALIIYKHRLSKQEIQACKAKYKNKYYLIKTFELSEENKNWLFADKKYWYFSKQEVSALIAEINLKNQQQIDEATFNEIWTEPYYK